MAAFNNNAAVSLNGGTISTAFTNVAGTQDVDLTGGVLTLNDEFTNMGTLTVGGGTIAGTGTLDNVGSVRFDVTSDLVADFSAITFKNSGVVTLTSLDNTSNGTLQTGDFVNNGTITYNSQGNDGMTWRLGSGGDGTLTNAGTITTELTQDQDVEEPFSIQGHIVADSTQGGVIHLADYNVNGVVNGSIRISQDLTLNDLSKVIIDEGISGIGGQLVVDNQITYGGTFEFRGRGAGISDYDAVIGSTSTGTPDRIDVRNSDGTSDFAGAGGEMLVPIFSSSTLSVDDPNITQQATHPNLQWDGSSGNDVMVGTTGSDTLTTGSGGSDALFGREGDDSFTLSAGASVRFIDGGEGTDLFYSAQLDFGQADSWKFNNLEAFDFTGAAGGTISMTESFVFGASEDANALVSGLGLGASLTDDALVIAGNAGQTLDLSSGSFTAAGTTVAIDHDGNGGTDSYAIYTGSNGANVFVDTDMSVNT